MKKIFLGITIVLTMLLGGCLTSDSDGEETKKTVSINTSEDELLNALVELGESTAISKRAVSDATSGQLAGVYALPDTPNHYYYYSFDDVANIAQGDQADKDAFMTKWNATSTKSDGKVIVGDEAITLADVETEMNGSRNSLISALSESGVTVDSSYVVSPETEVESYPSTAGAINKLADGTSVEVISNQYNSSIWNWVTDDGGSTELTTGDTTTSSASIDMYPRVEIGGITTATKADGVKLAYRKSGNTGWIIANIQASDNGSDKPSGWGSNWHEYYLSYSFQDLGISSGSYDITIMFIGSGDDYYQIVGHIDTDPNPKYITVTVN